MCYIPLLNPRVMAKAGCPQSGCTDTVRVNGRLSAGRLVNVVIPVMEPSGGVPADKWQNPSFTPSVKQYTT